MKFLPISQNNTALPFPHAPQYHNPFPQLHSVAILPFYNLSAEPTVNQDDVALAYYTELQQIPGFEVMPPGVVKQWLVANQVEIDGSTDFQMLARRLGVDVVIRGIATFQTPARSVRHHTPKARFI